MTEPGGTSRRRRRQLLVITLVAVATGVAGVVSSLFVRSPEQALADRAAPAATTLTAPVERRLVTETVILRGTVEPAARTVLPLVSGQGERAVVSRVAVAEGAQVDSGQVVLEVSGRPIAVLRGAIPAYRSLVPGDKGGDVTQLQEALVALGIESVEVDGSYGSETKAGVAQLYERMGYQPVIAGDPASVAAAADEVTAAQRRVDEARRALAKARDGEVPSAPADAGTTAGPGIDPVEQAEIDLDYAEDDLERAGQRLRDAEAVTGPSVPITEIVFVPELPATVDALPVRAGDDLSQVAVDGVSTQVVLSSGSLSVAASVDPARARLLSVGLAADILDEASGTSYPARISAIGEATTSVEEGIRVPVTVATDPSTPLPQALSDAPVRVTVASASSKAPVLAVPVSAVSTGAGGSVGVVVLEPTGARRRVEVRTGVIGDGYVEVTAVGSRLSTGDEVIIGLASASPAAPSAPVP